MNDNQEKLKQILDGFPNTPDAVGLVYTALTDIYPITVGLFDRPTINTFFYLLKSGNTIRVSAEDLAKVGFLRIVMNKLSVEEINKETYQKIIQIQNNFEKQPQKETAPASNILDKEQLEEISKAAEEHTAEEAEVVKKQEAEVKAWEKAYISQKKNAEPRIIELKPEEQEELQRLRLLLDQDGEEIFQQGVENSIKKRLIGAQATQTDEPLEEKLTSEQIETIAHLTAVDLTTKIASIPLSPDGQVPNKIAVVNEMAPLAALQAHERIAQIEGVTEYVNDVLSVHNQINIALQAAAYAVSPVASSYFYPSIQKEDVDQYEISDKPPEKPTAKDIVVVEIKKLAEYADLKNSIWKEAEKLGATPSDSDVIKLTQMLIGQTKAYQYVTHAVKRLRGQEPEIKSDWGGVAIIRNNALDLLKSKLTPTVKLVEVGGEKALQVMIGNKPISAVGGKVAQLVGKISGSSVSKIASGAALKTAAGATATKVATSLGLKGILTALGTAGGPIGMIAGWLASSFLANIASKIGVWIERHPKEFFFGSAAILGLPAIVTGSTLLAIPAGLALVAGIGPGGIIGGARTGLGLFLTTVSGTLVTIGTTVLVIIIAAPILVALILFIINNGAYMVPPSVETSGGGGTLAGACPDIWPTDGGYLTQGSFAPQCTHASLEAIDVGISGNPVFATHDGSVSFAGWDACYGNNIDIASECDGVAFYSRYSHLISISVVAGGKVKKGQQIAVGGAPYPASGICSTGPHLHYEFKDNKKYPNSPPFMWPPYIPKEVPRGCCMDTTPCNVSIP